MDTASQTASGLISGTPAYMSPEQARGDPTDHRTDIYSLGVVLYEMLAGRVPFEADSTLTVLHMHIHTAPPSIPGIPAEVQAVIDRALLKNPQDRYQTSREMAIDFYLSIGMNRQAETIREPYPVRAEPIEAPALPVPEPKQKQEPAAKVEPAPQTKPEPSPKPEPAQKEVSSPKPAPQTKSEPALKPAIKPKQEVKPERPAKPARNWTWIGLGLLSLVLCSVVAFGAYQFLANRPIVPTPTEALSTGIPNPSSSPVPSPTSGLPPATGMVQIPASTYVVGKDAADNYHSASQSITLPEFWIDQYPVTNQEFQQFMVEWQIPLGQEKFPVMGVKWEEADSYCKSLIKRLPSEAEWEAAGRGPGENPPLYPWGPDPAQARDLPNDPYEVGSLAFNRSPFEVYDLIGNVYEWVGEPYYASVEAGKKLLRAVRASVPEDLTFRVQVTPENTNYTQYAGFRCATTQVR
jgi:formylglycine-generating enzyme required for sulfatase activity